MTTTIRAAREELAALEAQLGPKLEYMAQLRALIEAHAALPKRAIPMRAPKRAPKRASKRSGKVVAQTEMATVDILKETGQPIRLGDLVAAVQARGVTIGGKNPVATLRARLEHASSIQTDRRRGVWLSDRPWPPEASDTPATQAGKN